MPTAASIADVEDLIGVTTLSTDATASARTEALLERAERTVLDELPGFTLGEVDDATVTVEADGDELLLLPYYPVRSITSVTVDGTLLTAADYELDGVLGYVRRRYSGLGSPHLNDGSTRRWPDRGVDIVVVYSYGYAASATPGAIRDTVTELAAGRIVNPQQVAQESLGDRSISFGGGGANADGLTGTQRHRLRHWRRTRVASARVRS